MDTWGAYLETWSMYTILHMYKHYCVTFYPNPILNPKPKYKHKPNPALKSPGTVYREFECRAPRQNTDLSHKTSKAPRCNRSLRLTIKSHTILLSTVGTEREEDERKG